MFTYSWSISLDLEVSLDYSSRIISVIDKASSVYPQGKISGISLVYWRYTQRFIQSMLRLHPSSIITLNSSRITNPCHKLITPCVSTAQCVFMLWDITEHPLLRSAMWHPHQHYVHINSSKQSCWFTPQPLTPCTGWPGLSGQ